MPDMEYDSILSIRRAETAWKYANNTLTQREALDMMCELQHIAGVYALEEFSVEGVIDQCSEYYGKDHPALPELAARAARRVWNKWDSDGELRQSAIDWAADLVDGYAREDGIHPLESVLEEETNDA